MDDLLEFVIYLFNGNVMVMKIFVKMDIKEINFVVGLIVLLVVIWIYIFLISDLFKLKLF